MHISKHKHKIRRKLKPIYLYCWNHLMLITELTDDYRTSRTSQQHVDPGHHAWYAQQNKWQNGQIFCKISYHFDASLQLATNSTQSQIHFQLPKATLTVMNRAEANLLSFSGSESESESELLSLESMHTMITQLQDNRADEHDTGSNVICYCRYKHF